MELIRGLHNLRPAHRGCVATIGNFDGVHRGHQALLAELSAHSGGLPVTVILFEPQPSEFFAPDRAPPRLMRLREKVQALARLPVDRLLCIGFNRRFAEMRAEAFVEEVLVGGLGVRYLVVGDDFRYGKGRSGDFAQLVEAGKRYGFQVARTDSFSLGGERVSSTAIREALAWGDLEKAERFLGRPYRICGRVAHGDKRGRMLGFPTANIHLHRRSVPLTGVYAVAVGGVGPGPIEGVANIGMRPTVGGTRALLEVHLFDFASEIYGSHLEVDFLKRLRPERRFESFEALSRQIGLDVRQAREFFQRREIFPPDK